MRRRALLLAIATYRQLPTLGYVANDIPRLRAALVRAGFDLEEIDASGAGVDESQAGDVTSTKLRRRIRDFLSSAGQDDELLIFLSGHGVEIDGRRALLPQDYDPKEPENPDRLVSDGWISNLARSSPARSVVVLIDACREGTRLVLGPIKSPQPTSLADAPLRNAFIDNGTDEPTIAFLYSCGAGEQSGSDRQEGGCSAFTRAFAEAIEMENGPAELESLSIEARSLLARYSGGTQTLTASGRPGRGESWQGLVVKENEAARFRERLTRSNWSGRLNTTKLFQQVEARLPTFTAQLRAIAMRAEEQVAEARRVLPSQHWRDENAWFRLATRVHHIFLAAGAASIQAAEAAVLLAVPLVYEAVLAEAEIRLGNVGAVPPDPEGTTGTGYLVGAWRRAWDASDAAQIRRSLIKRQKTDAAADHASWALVDFCHTSGELWDVQYSSQQRSGWALQAVTALLAPAPFPDVIQDRRVCDILSAPRLLRLARLMFANFDEVTLDAAAGGGLLDPQAGSGEGSEQLTVDEVRLAHLINLGAQLALDPRRLPPLLAEHVGSDDTLSATWLTEHLAAAEWRERKTDSGVSEQGERWFDLNLECDNDAVDAALLAVVDGLESYRTRLSQRQDVHATSTRGLLPAGFTANRLNARPSGWRPTRPPLRFELNRTRIIGLLMGQQLYGEKWPALRELYQNALDACRYRRAQEQLALGPHDRGISSRRAYKGRIIIRCGAEATRRYIECVDDGIGMADRHIRRLFAFAGQRFADSHEFHIDCARWDEAEIPFFPNSRFGVGVLSYFMLAEELDIVSHRYAPPGEPGHTPVRARIIGTGSLFRLDSILDPKRLAAEYGTSVRLYLRQDAPSDTALISSILNWLCIPEVGTTIQKDVQEQVDLEAGKPTKAFRAILNDVMLPVVGSESTTGAPSIYIAPQAERVSTHPHLRTASRRRRNMGEKAALVDGIATDVKNSESARWPSSLVVNLTEKLRASLTVDRRQVDANDNIMEPVWDCIRQNAGAALAAWEAPDFVDLHRTLRDLGPQVVVGADAALRTGAPVAAATLRGTEVLWPLSEAGVSTLDPDIACDVALASHVDARLASRWTLPNDDDSLRWSIVLSVRGGSELAVHPVVDQAIVSRAVLLVKAGLDLPIWLRRAVSFEVERLCFSAPIASGPVLAAINEVGQVWLRDAIQWVDDSHAPVLMAARELAMWRPGLLAFDERLLDTLGPLHRELARLSAGNLLSWVDLAFFSQSKSLLLKDVLELARDLSKAGIKIPESDVGHLVLTEDQMRILSVYYHRAENHVLRQPAGLNAIQEIIENYASFDFDFGMLQELTPWLANDVYTPCIPGLSLEQRLLLSRNLDAGAPFMSHLTLAHIFDAANRPEFRSIKEVGTIARSLCDTGIDLGIVRHLDEGIISWVSDQPSSARPLFARLADSVDRYQAVHIWDVALAATVATESLLPMLEFIDRCGVDVARCRAFLSDRAIG